jgi:hypothetical protein
MPIPSITKYGAKQCASKSKRTGEPCLNLAKTGWRVCRMHGARKSKKVLIGKEHPNYVHGERSKQQEILNRKKSLMFQRLEELGRHIGVLSGKKTPGRKTGSKLDLNCEEGLVAAIKESRDE